MSKIIYTNSDGTVSIVQPILTEINPNTGKPFTIEEIAEKDIEKGISYEIVDDSAIPTDRSFRDAWKQNDKTIETDIDKAREIHKTNIREARTSKLQELDIEFQKAQETSADTSDIVAKKQALRDAPAAAGISTAATETDLKAQWDTSILGDSPYS
tara:strand:- start:163 stop:630 length:468 start_codon:yes stop_codon:yes gene_type:complete